MTEKKEELSDIENDPPFFNNWKSIYLVVLLVLAVLILLFYMFTLKFS